MTFVSLIAALIVVVAVMGNPAEEGEVGTDPTTESEMGTGPTTAAVECDMVCAATWCNPEFYTPTMVPSDTYPQCSCVECVEITEESWWR